MKKLLALLLALLAVFSLSGCALLELMEDEKNAVQLGGDGEAVRWNLVSQDNALGTVESAYFEFEKNAFRYFENGALKREGDLRVTYFGAEGAVSPLNICLYLNEEEFDYITCYTEDARESLCQFTVMAEGYRIEPVRTGGVPIRDYHVSEMPYAFGTYVKEGGEARPYENGKANYLGSAALDGLFEDAEGNRFYFLNNSFSFDPQSVHYTVYMRYESKAAGTAVEGTVKMSYYEEFDSGKPHNVALIYVMHGEGEPAAESGVSVEADFRLMDFDLGEDGSFSFASGAFFDEESACEFDPAQFIGGVYRKVTDQ